MPTAPDTAPTAACAKARSSRCALRCGLEGEAGELDAEGGRLGVDAVGASGAQRVDVLAGFRREDVGEAARVGQDQPRHRLNLEGQAGVEHVGGGQPVVDPAAGRAGRRREDVDEGGGVVVGDLLALVDRLHGEGGGADGVELVRGGAVHLLAGGHLDSPHGVEARVVRPRLAQLPACVAGDQGRRRLRDGRAARLARRR